MSEERRCGDEFEGRGGWSPSGRENLQWIDLWVHLGIACHRQDGVISKVEDNRGSVGHFTVAEDRQCRLLQDGV